MLFSQHYILFSYYEISQVLTNWAKRWHDLMKNPFIDVESCSFLLRHFVHLWRSDLEVRPQQLSLGPQLLQIQDLLAVVIYLHWHVN